MTLGELIAVARECKGWSLRDLEKQCGVSNALLSQIEPGQIKDPGFSKVVEIMDALGLSLDRAATNIRRKRDVLRQAAERSAKNRHEQSEKGEN